MRKNFIRELMLRWAPTLSFALIFWLILRLYRLPADALYYAAALCAALWAVIAALRFRKRRRRIEAVRRLLKMPSASVPELLPPPGSVMEEEYQALVRELCRRITEEETEFSTERRELNEYYALWAHQIKTPIAAMRLLLQADADADKLQGELIRVEQYVEMALRVLRLDEAESDLAIVRTELDTQIRQSVRRFARLFVLKKLRLESEPTGIVLESDPKWLSFLIEQLLSNAIKYTPPGGLVRIRANGSELIIEDSGIGISAEDLPRVFEKGFTGFNGHEDRRSTGIGLYLCRRICGLLGFGIRLESEQGRGTRAIVDLTQEKTRFE